MHSCVGRIRYLGVMLYDADRIEAVASCDESELIDRQMEIYLDPNDPAVIKAAKANGITDSTIDAAQKSPTYKFIKEWGVALPLHPEFRTIPNLFYVPPLLPAMATVENGTYNATTDSLWAKIDASRMPIQYLASLFSAGNGEKIKEVFRKLMTVRLHRRDVTVGDLDVKELNQALKDTGMTRDEADAIFRLTSLPLFDQRFVIPAAHREESMEMLESTADVKGNTGFGFKETPARGL
jgi:nitrate reductase beta subunit